MRSMQRFWGAYRNQAARVGRGISGEVVFKFFSLSLARNDLNLKDAAELNFSLLISTSKNELILRVRGPADTNFVGKHNARQLQSCSCGLKVPCARAVFYLEFISFILNLFFSLKPPNWGFARGNPFFGLCDSSNSGPKAQLV